MDEPVRTRLKAALRGAMKARDAAAVARCARRWRRSTTRRPSTRRPHRRARAFAGTAGGLGAGEAPRALLEEEQERAIVAREAQERRDAADDYERLGQADEAARLRAEADLLATFV